MQSLNEIIDVRLFTLTKLYPRGRAEYLAKFAAATDSAVKAGFILEADRPEILALAAAAYPAAP
jgi:hypothetical protein